MVFFIEFLLFFFLLVILLGSKNDGSSLGLFLVVSNKVCMLLVLMWVICWILNGILILGFLKINVKLLC